MIVFFSTVSVTVIVTSPFEMPFTLPFLSTVAIAGLLLFHFSSEAYFFGVTVALSCSALPIVSFFRAGKL